jgi:hypothetical protein
LPRNFEESVDTKLVLDTFANVESDVEGLEERIVKLEQRLAKLSNVTAKIPY